MNKEKAPEKKSNNQVILEAKANIEFAKMLNAIDSMSTTLKQFPTNSVDGMVTSLQQSIVFIKSIKDFISTKGCVNQEISIVKQIIDGISTKAQYETTIKAYQAKMEITRVAYKEIQDENIMMKSKLARFIDQYIVGSKELVPETFRQELGIAFTPLEAVIERSIGKYRASLPKQCTSNYNDQPF